MKYYIICSLVMISLVCQSQVVIHLEAVPETTPAKDSIFLAGDINSWLPSDTAYRFDLIDGEYWLNVSGFEKMEFKITRGSWEKVEGNKYGVQLPNRSYILGTQDTLHLTVLSWQDQVDVKDLASTANKQVSVWKDSMEISQLNRMRRIWVYLPIDYEVNGKSYPVLYMHDGQNLFDASTGFKGEWEIDETLTAMEQNGESTAIVVAIDNGGSNRISEYSTFTHPTYGGGEGEAYLNFIVNTLKPAVDLTFRTLSDRENTGIMGSSMGGLISHSAYIRHQDTFGKIGIFSPSYWFSDEYFSEMTSFKKKSSPRIYMLVGEKESDNYMATVARKMHASFLQLGYDAEEIKLNPLYAIGIN